MNTLFLIGRVVHILAAGLWLGSIFFLSMFLTPVLQTLGPDAGKVLVGLKQRGLLAFMPSLAGFVILTGIYLYWHLTGFSGANMNTTEAMVFGTGGILGLTALIIGGAIVARGLKRSVALIEQMAGKSDKERAAMAGELLQLRPRIATFSRVVLVLIAATTVLMELGHYV